jgi:hypothetical protein
MSKRRNSFVFEESLIRLLSDEYPEPAGIKPARSSGSHFFPVRKKSRKICLGVVDCVLTASGPDSIEENRQEHPNNLPLRVLP